MIDEVRARLRADSALGPLNEPPPFWMGALLLLILIVGVLA